MNWPNQWFRARLYQVRNEVNQMMSQFRLSEALKTIYSLIWDDSMMTEPARAAEFTRRKVLFTQALANMKTLAEGGTVLPPRQ